MSSDNGVYIIKFPEGYRVAHCQAIENIDYYPKGSKERKEVLKDYFSKSRVYKTFDEANNQAHKLYNEKMEDYFCPIVEYGIQYLGEYESWKTGKKKKKI